MDNNMLILSEGMHTSIQDLGRKGYRAFGVPISGAMDKYSAILANKLLNNDEKLPVMEMTLIGPKILFEDNSLIVLTGADMAPHINGEAIQMNFVYKVTTSDVLSFGNLKTGARTYLGVKGGFLTEEKLNSFSYYEGVTSKEKVQKGDRLKIASIEAGLNPSSSKIKVKSAHFKEKKLEVTKGPEFNRLTKKHRELLFSKEFKIDAHNNRMGYQLKNKFPPIKNGEIITSTTIPGTIQLTPSGKLIIMMRDCPTTGGYPRILQLTDIAINQLAQKKENDSFKFDLESSFDFLGRLVNRFKD
ncbi:biotin-dependent carboxyltransferase family protein [Lutimonas sp.]|uniref:5-oxoprolinase subunit C family protein n=1 Tax=Lutimonas sp. TaxID=1872403 RepID=UPI003D9BA6D3